MQGNFIQALDAGAALVFLVGFVVWQLVATSLAKKRRVAREKAKASGEAI